MRRLIAAAKRQMPAACIPFGDAAARLERRVGLAVLCEARRDGAFSSRESRIDVAGREGLVRDEVGLMLGIDRSRGGKPRCRHVRHGSQRCVVDGDGFRAIDRGGPRLGNHAGNKVAGEAHLVDGKWRQVDRLQAFDRRRNAQRGRGPGHVGARPHGNEPGTRSAALPSIRSILAWACGLRRNTACNACGTSMSPM